MSQNDASDRPAQVLPARRVARRQAPVMGAALLADCSLSMEERDGAPGAGMLFGGTGPRRIDRLAKVLDYLLTRVRVQALVCFGDSPVEIPLSGRVVLPEPEGSTNLALALEHVGTLRPVPTRCFVLSDGMPNSVEEALAWARRLRPMVLDCYYVGPEAYPPGLKFMAELSAAGGPGGRSGHFDLVDPVLLGSELERRLLTRPRG